MNEANVCGKCNYIRHPDPTRMCRKCGHTPEPVIRAATAAAHGPGCFRKHRDCSVALVEELAGLVREGLWETITAGAQQCARCGGYAAHFKDCAADEALAKVGEP